MSNVDQRIAHLQRSIKRHQDAQAVWWAAFTVARAAGELVPVDVRLELMDAQWQGYSPGPEVAAMFAALAEQLPDEDWWFLVCSYGEYDQALKEAS